MTEYNKKDNQGAIFKNDRKEKDIHPDYKGSVVVNGVEYWVSSWINESKAGDKYMSLSLTKKEEKSTSEERTQNDDPIVDDEIPF